MEHGTVIIHDQPMLYDASFFNLLFVYFFIIKSYTW